MKGALWTPHLTLNPGLRVLKILGDSLQQSKLKQGEEHGGGGALRHSLHCLKALPSLSATPSTRPQFPLV